MKKIRTRTAVAIALILIFLFGYMMVDTMGSRLSEFSILLNILGMVNVVLIVVLVFMILRSVVKPYLEGRRFPRLNLSLRTKMVSLTFLLVVVPATVIVGMGTVIIYNILDNWHNPELVSVMNSAKDIVSRYETAMAKETAHYARVLGDEVTIKLLNSPKKLPVFLKQRLERYELSSIELYRNGQMIAMIRDEKLPIRSLKPASVNWEKQLKKGEPFHDVSSLPTGAYVRFGSLMPLGKGIEDRYMVVTGRFIVRKLANHLDQLTTAAQRYRETQRSIRSLKTFNVSSLLLIAIIAVFSGTWAGLKFTDDFLKAFNLLLNGTERVSRGELDFGIEVRGKDEMGRLMQSFNEMIDQLRTHEQELRLRAIELESVNRFLEDKKHYFEAVLDALPVGVISLNSFGNIFSMNRFSREMLGIRGRVEEGTRFTTLLSDEGGSGQLKQLVSRVTLDPEPSVRQSIVFETREGVRTTDVTLTMLRDQMGEEIGFLIIVEDITQLEQAQKTLAWKEAVRRIVHELKNPLTPIKLAAERIQFTAKKGSDRLREVVLDSVQPMIEEINSMQKLIENFSRYAKMPPPRLENVSVHELLEETINLLEKAGGKVIFRRIYAEHVPVQKLDRALMKSAFLNIFRNAIAAMEGDPEGTITVKTIYFAAGRRVQIEISDTGKGIDPRIREKIFIPYFSTKAKGDGLGLAIVHNIVTALNGHISVKSNYPRGSTFVIDLPVV
ncbi:MAG: HAMP domain-containing protein [Acidobacteria bacterium]|nr:HAMP domain-containing protein [Acidobacteriota bacterium]